MVALLLAAIFIGYAGAFMHPIIVPDNIRHMASDHAGSFKYNSSIRLPDSISVTEYYVKIQPYYPAPGITFDKSRNMTFDGSIVMSINVKKATSSITLNSYNLKYSEMKLTDIRQKTVRIRYITYDKELQQICIYLSKNFTRGAVLILSAKYAGTINPYVDGGLFYTFYMDLNREIHWMVATQMEAFAARYVFPCLDEPAYKATFHFELVYPTAHVALSNMMGTDPIDLGEGWSQVTFEPTPLMSTYLTAFTIGPFVSYTTTNKDGILTRAWGWTGHDGYLKFAAETAGECLHQMSLYTGIKYPINKCDNVALPQFPAGAMENYGLILYKYQLIPYNNLTMTTLEKIESARVICHEVTHMWYGDLVTAKWWDNLFLNEGFAAYFMRIMLGKVFPEEADFVDSTMLSLDREQALKQDAGPSTHPLIAPDGPHFDKITYKKGAALLRMLSDVMGPEVLRDGIRRHLRNHEYDVASHVDLFESLTEAAFAAKIQGWFLLLNVTHLMMPYSHQTSFPLINVHFDKKGLKLSQETYNEISTNFSSPYNYKWIVPLRTAAYNSASTKIHWMVPEELWDTEQRPFNSINRWHIVAYASASYGRVFYDDESFNSLLKKIISEDVPLGVKITLVGDEVALIERQESKGLPYSYTRLLNLLNSVFNTPSTDDPSFTLADMVLPQMEFFASILRDSIDAPLIERFFNKVFGKIYKSDMWEQRTSSWNTNSFRYIFLPYAVKYNIGDSAEMARKFFKDIYFNCMGAKSSNGTSWCSGVHNDIRRAIYCGAAKYDKDNENFANLMHFYSGEVQVNPYFFQEYRALLEGMTCVEDTAQLRTLVRLFLESPLQPTMLFDWLKTNPRASEVLLNFLSTRSASVLAYDGLAAYLDAMTYNWMSRRRLQQFVNLRERLLPSLDDDQKKLFQKYEEKIRMNIQWSQKHRPSVMKWMYDNLVIAGKDRWNRRLPGTLTPKRYDVEIAPYIPGSGKYPPQRNMTFDGSVVMTFTVTSETSEIVLNAHRLVIDTDDIELKDSQNKDIEIQPEISKDFENGMLTIHVATKLVPGMLYSLRISYAGFIFGHSHQGLSSVYNFYEFEGKQGWIFATAFEGGPGARSLMVCCDEPSYKAVFHISVKHPADMTALSNTMNAGTVVSKDGWAVTSFQDTPVMSTYLVAICVGHFAFKSDVSKGGTLLRVYSWLGMEKYAEFSLKVMSSTLEYMSETFNYSYPLSKLDIVALPQFVNGGTVENWGLILGNYQSLMVDLAYSDSATLGRVASTISREVVHQWFGNLVSTNWWSDLFLNEGSATYWSLLAVNNSFQKQETYVNYARFVEIASALESDCNQDTLALITEDGAPFRPMVSSKGGALLSTLSSVLSMKTFIEALRNYIAKNAYGNVKSEDLWMSLTEACIKDGVKAWDGKLLNVSIFMDTWTSKLSYPILKASYSHNTNKISYQQESCVRVNASNTLWHIPVLSAKRNRKELNWFIGRNGSSEAWLLDYPPERVDNLRRSTFLRMHYDQNSWKALLQNVRSFDVQTQGAILDDAWFFTINGNYTWTRFLDLMQAIAWDLDTIPWVTGLKFFEKMYSSFRFHEEFGRILRYLTYKAKWTYDITFYHMRPRKNWDHRILGGQIGEWMCRMNFESCLEFTKANFIQFGQNCRNSFSGTAHCFSIIPDFRRTHYCYGLRQKPEYEDVVISQYKYFAVNASEFIRDGERLLYSLSCLKDNQKLEHYVHLALQGDLPPTLITYIGQNEVSGQLLYNYFVNNIREVLESDVPFDLYAEAMTKDWSRTDQLHKIIGFQGRMEYKLLNSEQKAIWKNLILKIFARQKWLDENANEIINWIKNIEISGGMMLNESRSIPVS